MKRILQSLLMVPILSLGLGLSTAGFAYAQQPVDTETVCDPTSPSISEGAECARGNEQASELFGDGSIFQRVTNILLFLVGAIAVIMLIIGGIRYVVSGGDQNAVTSAKNTILYAIIGIIVAFLAFAAVNFVTSQLEATTETTAVQSRLG